METRSVVCPGIHCGHCTARIARELGALPGVAAAQADAGTKQVTVQWGPPATWAEICRLLDELGYPPERGA